MNVFDVTGIADVIATCERTTSDREFGMMSVLPKNGEMNLESMQYKHSTEAVDQRVRTSTGGYGRPVEETGDDPLPPTGTTGVAVRYAGRGAGMGAGAA